MQQRASVCEKVRAHFNVRGCVRGHACVREEGLCVRVSMCVRIQAFESLVSIQLRLLPE